MSSLKLTPAELSALLLSLKVAVWCVVVMVVPGVWCGWLLARKRFPGRALLDAAIHVPLVLPPVVTGYLLLLLLGRNSLLGSWLHDGLGIEIAFTFWAAVIASAVMGFPLMVRAVRLSVELVDTGLECAAGTLGASPRRVLLTITLPLALPGILVGVILAFARSLGEFGATITFAGSGIQGETRTLPLAVFDASQSVGGDASAIRLIVISIVLALSALIVSEWLARRVNRRLGRT